MSNRFDFSKIDEALPGAEKMQREERLANTLEDNYKAVHALCDMVENLRTDFWKPCPKWTGLFLPCDRQAKSPSARKPDGYWNGKGIKSVGR